jgi:glycosyltransferase involved in cell wall biosynthesis
VRKTTHVIYLCHVVDESLKRERAITTDSPAATKKVFALCRAMLEANMSCTVLSAGRGRQNGSGSWHRQISKRHEGIVSLYASYYHVPFLTHLVTMLSLSVLLFTLLKKHPGAKILVYNRSYHYVPALLLAKLMNDNVYLDLEDGYINESKGILRKLKNTITKNLYELLCPSGTLLAATSLRNQIKNKHSLVCYGVANETEMSILDWSLPKLRILFGGTLLEEVGSKLLLDGLKIAYTKNRDLHRDLEIIVTGKGPWADAFSEFARKNPYLMTVAQDLSEGKYTEILRSCHIGLSLRLTKFEMGTTTFPSKVIEYASYGLLVLSSRVGDVASLLGEAAIYIERETPEALAEQLLKIDSHRQNLQTIALLGRARVMEQCNSLVVGNALAKFFEVGNNTSIAV